MLGCGLRRLGCGLCRLGCGLRRVGCGLRRLGCGLRRLLREKCAHFPFPLLGLSRGGLSVTTVMHSVSCGWISIYRL
jgi:hypothetical protein